MLLARPITVFFLTLFASFLGVLATGRHDPPDTLSAGLLIITQDTGRFVFVRDRKDKQFTIPGGMRMPGERLFKAAARETMEETRGVITKHASLIQTAPSVNLRDVWTFPFECFVIQIPTANGMRDKFHKTDVSKRSSGWHEMDDLKTFNVRWFNANPGNNKYVDKNGKTFKIGRRAMGCITLATQRGLVPVYGAVKKNGKHLSSDGASKRRDGEAQQAISPDSNDKSRDGEAQPISSDSNDKGAKSGSSLEKVLSMSIVVVTSVFALL